MYLKKTAKKRQNSNKNRKIIENYRKSEKIKIVKISPNEFYVYPLFIHRRYKGNLKTKPTELFKNRNVFGISQTLVHFSSILSFKQQFTMLEI